jgi:hypothetical protein
MRSCIAAPSVALAAPALALALALVPGCGTSSSDAAPASGVPATEQITVFVVEPQDPAAARTVPKALSGAKVVADFADGFRSSGATDADGRVLLAATDTTKPFSVMAYTPRHTIQVYSGLTVARTGLLPMSGAYFPAASSSDVVVTLIPLASSQETVRLSGALKNTAAEGDTVSLTTWSLISPAGTFKGGDSAYRIAIPEGVPVSLIGAEWATSAAQGRVADQSFSQWFQVDVPAATADTTLDIDVAAATKLSPTKFQVTCEIPGGATGPFAGAKGYVRVTSIESGGLFIGSHSHTEPIADGATFSISGEYVQVPGIHAQYYAYTQNTDGSFAAKFARGYPADGTALTGLFSPLAVTPPASIDQPITIGPRPPGSIAEYQLFTKGGDMLLQLDDVDEGATTLLVPPLSVDAAAMLLAAMNGRVVSYAWSPDPEVGTGVFVHTVSSSRTFPVQN